MYSLGCCILGGGCCVSAAGQAGQVTDGLGDERGRGFLGLPVTLSHVLCGSVSGLDSVNTAALLPLIEVV